MNYVRLAGMVTPETRKALGLQGRLTKEELQSVIGTLRDRPDSDFPKGRWATIQQLQLLLSSGTDFRVVRRDISSNELICLDGVGEWNCGQTAEEFGLENLTDEEKQVIGILRPVEAS